jgi:hypothetical protein
VIPVKNITLSIDEDLLEAGREYARKHRISLNALIRRLLAHAVYNSSNQWLSETYELMDSAQANSGGQKSKREDLYRV